MERRTMLKLAAGVAGAATVGATHRPESAAAASFAEVAGWPAEARFDAIEDGRSGTWAIGTQRLEDRPDGSWQRKAIVHRLHRRGWAPARLPDDFGAWARAITPDGTGAWIVGDRNDVSLPEADGTTVVGHLALDGTWRSVDTERLPAFCGFSSLALIDGRIELTGYVPADGGRTLRPYCLTRPLRSGPAAWSEQPVDAPAWASDVLPSLTIAKGTTDWATAANWLLRRFRSGWATVDGPPGRDAAWHGPCAVGGRSLYLATEDPEAMPRVRLHRRVGSTWTEVELPAGVTISEIVPTAHGCWAVGDRYAPETGAITVIALRVTGSAVVQRLDGPAGAAHDACRLEGGLLIGGIRPDPQDPEWADWFGQSWFLRG